MESFGVVEYAAQAAVPRGEAAELEVLGPSGIFLQHAQPRRGLETETRVVPGVAQDGDTRLAESVGRGQRAVHQGGAHAVPLVFRQNPQWAEAESRFALDVAPTAHDVSDDLVAADRDDGQARDRVAVSEERVHEPGLGTGAISGRPECLSVNITNRGVALGCRAMKEHSVKDVGAVAVEASRDVDSAASVVAVSTLATEAAMTAPAYATRFQRGNMSTRRVQMIGMPAGMT